MSRCSAADAAAADADDICRFCGYRDITASIKLDFRAREELTNRRRLRNTLKMLRFLTIACLICNYGIRPAEAQGRVYKGRVEPSVRHLLEDFFERGDRSMLFGASLELEVKGRR